jgi:hypothetical protein
MLIDTAATSKLRQIVANLMFLLFIAVFNILFKDCNKQLIYNTSHLLLWNPLIYVFIILFCIHKGNPISVSTFFIYSPISEC